jgi:integrase
LLCFVISELPIMADNALAVRPAAAIEQAQDGGALDELIDFALATLPSAASVRIYRQTYTLWRSWCAQKGANPLDLRPVAVLGFIGAQNVTKATRQRQLSALRKLAQVLYIAAPTEETRRIVEALKVIKAPTGSENGRERTRKALAPSEADKVLRVWNEPTNMHRRNNALIAVLALGALRRSEAAALQWRDVDFENGVVTVRHGKGDKARDVPLAGDFALEALQAWQACQMERTYVFCPVVKGDKLGKDKPISGTDVYRIVKATEALSGIAFKPHDLRRTFITEALATGTPLATVQAAAGHARGETTLRYAQAVDARRARRELKLRYG